MNQCIRKLPQHGRQLLYRRYHERMTTTGLAHQMNVSIDALRHRLMRVRQSVKKCMSLQVEGTQA